MRGVYESTYRISAVSAAKTLIYITVPSTITVDMLDTQVSNESNETNEQLLCVWQRVTSLGTPTATAVTPRKKEQGDQASACTVKANVTASEPTYGSIAQGADPGVSFAAKGFPSLGGYADTPIPETRFTIAPGDTYGLRLINAPSSAIDVVIAITHQERG